MNGPGQQPSLCVASQQGAGPPSHLKDYNTKTWSEGEVFFQYQNWNLKLFEKIV